MRNLAMLALAALLLGACAGNPITSSIRQVADAESPAEARELLSGIVREDLEEALRSAQVHEDRIAATCWSGLLAQLDKAGDESYFTEPKGVFSTYQKARNVRRLLTDGVGDEIKIACAALRSDSRSAIIDIIRKVSPL